MLLFAPILLYMIDIYFLGIELLSFFLILLERVYDSDSEFNYAKSCDVHVIFALSHTRKVRKKEKKKQVK